MYWLGYAAVLAGLTSYAFFMKMSAQDKTEFFKKMGM
jgi:hypothetical protein